MEKGLFTEIWEQITAYVSGLDWAYILTFIVIAYGINHSKVAEKIGKATKLKTEKKYRTALIGIVYGIARGIDLAKIEGLFQSFVFAIVFHNLIIETVMKYVQKKIITKKTKPSANEKHHKDDHEQI